ncbi:MAG TPA: metallopeptidase TldD-related protein [Terriglobia bacterium]|nr:metallopeptidase TldD-related protein [Terriglobia bacterium]
MKKRIHFLLRLSLPLILSGSNLAWCKDPTSAATADPVSKAMEQELERAKSGLAKSDPAPYFISYAIYDQELLGVAGSLGSILTSTRIHQRMGDVMMRVGTAALDNTHKEGLPSAITSGLIPLGDNAEALDHALWGLTNREFRQAEPAFLKVTAATAVRAEEEDKSPDFSQETPQVHFDNSSAILPSDQKAWEDEVRRYSANFRKYPVVYSSTVFLQAERTRWFLASTEGAQIVVPSAIARLVIQASTRADDGMDLLRAESFEAPSASDLPREKEIIQLVDKMAGDLAALRKAPVQEAFNGPALLSGRSAAVFFHEVLGHRLEGHRQKSEDEGQTFTKKVGEQILPKFLSIVDDPTLPELSGTKLAGSYKFDDEGVPARRVEVVTDGVLKSFLMSRMPVKGFDQSNGHGRRQPGLMPTGRQGNFIVISKNTVKDSELRQRFIEEIKKQGKPYGLYFQDVQGGFTLTGREAPQAFQILPVMVWRVYPDGRPDELVRGVDIVGTPLAALDSIILTGDKTDVFNGVCGAESGSVPVSAAAPAILFSEMEIQKRANTHSRPPLLPPPGFESAGAAAKIAGTPEVKRD